MLFSCKCRYQHQQGRLWQMKICNKCIHYLKFIAFIYKYICFIIKWLYQIFIVCFIKISSTFQTSTTCCSYTKNFFSIQYCFINFVGTFFCYNHFFRMHNMVFYIFYFHRSKSTKRYM